MTDLERKKNEQPTNSALQPPHKPPTLTPAFCCRPFSFFLSSNEQAEEPKCGRGAAAKVGRINSTICVISILLIYSHLTSSPRPHASQVGTAPPTGWKRKYTACDQISFQKCKKKKKHILSPAVQQKQNPRRSHSE